MTDFAEQTLTDAGLTEVKVIRPLWCLYDFSRGSCPCARRVLVLLSSWSSSCYPNIEEQALVQKPFVV